MKILKFLLPIVLISATFGTSAYAGIGGLRSLHNEEIDSDIRQNIHALNDKIIQSMKNNEPQVLYGLFTDEVKSQKDMRTNNEKMYQQMKPVMEKISLKIFNEYYVVSVSLGKTISIVSSETKEKFFISLNPASGETYISLLESEETGILLILIYKKIGGSWRVETAHVGWLKVGNKSALAWYEEALSFYKKGEFLPAQIRMGLIRSCLRPAPFIQYENESEIIALGKKNKSELEKKITFPWKIVEVSGIPEIYGINPDFVDGEPVAMVIFITKSSLNNPSLLQQEAEAMLPALRSKFPGIDSSSYVYFTAFSEYPTDPNKRYEKYGLRVATAV